MDQRLMFALIGALPGLVPALLMYLQKKKEIAATEPVGLMNANAAAEAAMRIDLQEQLKTLKEEIKELKLENKELRAENRKLELRILELEKLNLNVKQAWNDGKK